MTQKPHYGFPLSFVLFRIIFISTIILLLILLLIISASIYLIIFIYICFLPFYLYFGIIQLKKNFLIYRRRLLEKIINIADIKGDEIVLDLGTGSGFLAVGFSKKLHNGISFGLDKFSLKSKNLKSQIINMIKINFIWNTLKIARENAKIENVEKKCKFIQTDITKSLDFTDNYFDIIVASQFFYCIPHQKRMQVFQEINRVLKKGGKIIFFESKSFIKWKIEEVKDFFENIGYKIQLIPIDEFKKCCILYGEK